MSSKLFSCQLLLNVGLNGIVEQGLAAEFYYSTA